MRTVVEMRNSGMVTLLRDCRIEGLRSARRLAPSCAPLADLHELYELFSLIGSEGIEVMTHCMSMFLRESGRALVEDTADPSPVVYIQVCACSHHLLHRLALSESHRSA